MASMHVDMHGEPRGGAAATASSLQLHHSPRDYRNRTDIVVSRMPCQGFEDAQRCLGIASAKDDRAKHCGCYPIAHQSLPFPDHVSHKRTCQFADAHHSLCLPAGVSLRPTWARLAAKLDGASFLFHPSVPSGEFLSMATSYGEVIPRCQKIVPRHA